MWRGGRAAHPPGRAGGRPAVPGRGAVRGGTPGGVRRPAPPDPLAPASRRPDPGADSCRRRSRRRPGGRVDPPPMRQLINSTFITLDGMIENPHLWPPLDAGTSGEGDRIQTDLLEACDIVLMGPRTYDSFP